MPGTRSRTISTSRSSEGCPIQWKSAAPLERVVELAGPVRGQHDRGHATRANRPELGNRDLEVREDLEQERLELLVRAVDLVDQEHDRLVRVDRLEQRPADQELRAEELVLGDRSLLRGADVEELARVVPLVDGVRDVEALVALEPDQPGAERRRERLRGLGLPDTRLAFEQERLLEREREEQRRREPAIGQVVGVSERRLEVVDRAEAHARSVHRPFGAASKSRIDHLCPAWSTRLDSRHGSNAMRGWEWP